MRVRIIVGQGRICPLELRVKKGKKLQYVDGKWNRGSLVKRGGLFVFGKIYLEILVDQNTQGENFCKI